MTVDAQSTAVALRNLADYMTDVYAGRTVESAWKLDAMAHNPEIAKVIISITADLLRQVGVSAGQVMRDADRFVQQQPEPPTDARSSWWQQRVEEPGQLYEWGCCYRCGNAFKQRCEDSACGCHTPETLADAVSAAREHTDSRFHTPQHQEG